MIYDQKVPIKKRIQVSPLLTRAVQICFWVQKTEEKIADCAASQPDYQKETVVFKELPVKQQNILASAVFYNIIVFYPLHLPLILK